MASYDTNLKSWGATGSQWPDGYNYLEGEQPVDAWDNYFADKVISDIKDHLIPLTNSRIESDKGASGGEPSSPEASHLYGDEGSGRLRWYDSVNATWHDVMHRDGDTMSGVLNMGGHKIEDSTGTLTLGGDVDVGGSLSAASLSAGSLSAGGVSLDNENVTSVNQVGGSGLFFDFNQSSNGVELVDGSGSRDQLVTKDVYVDEQTQWLSSHISDSNAHHSRYSDSEARTAVDGANVSIAGDADTVDGQDASELGKSTSEVQTESMIHSSGFAPNFAG